MSWDLDGMRPAELAGTLEFDDGTKASVPVTAPVPATQGRIMMAFTVPADIPASRRVAAARIRNEEAGLVFARRFAPYLNTPPGGTLTISFTVADAQALW